jgi:uncharacterized membrane protein YphA (DoxX/SURF4 family)
MALRFRSRADRSQAQYQTSSDAPLTLTERRVDTGMSGLEQTAMLAGRLIFGGYFIYSGIKHFAERESMIGYATAKGVAFPEVAVLGSGAMLVAGGVSLLTGMKPTFGASLITAFLTGVTPTMHDYWNVEDPGQRANELVNFTKNLALIGGAALAVAVAERSRATA